MHTHSLSIGKRRGLMSTSTPEHIFTVLAFDHRQSFVKMVPSEKDALAAYPEVASTKIDVIKTLSPSASAVLLDPLFSAAPAIARDALPAQTGLLVAVETSGYSGESTARVSSLLSDWGVKKIKRMGADAVKLLIYYHPDAGELTEKQERLTKQVSEACRGADIAFFLEPLTYSLDPNQAKASSSFAAERPDLIRRVAERLSAYQPDVLKLEFPVDSHQVPEKDIWYEACQAVSEAARCPWTVLSAGVDFDLFADQVETACRAGASGFIGGRAIWKEGISRSRPERLNWLDTVARKRLETLSEIASRYGKPWTDFFPPDDLEDYENWYVSYGNEDR